MAPTPRDRAVALRPADQVVRRSSVNGNSRLRLAEPTSIRPGVWPVVKKRAMETLAADVEIVPAANGDLVGLMGALAVAIEGAGSR